MSPSEHSPLRKLLLARANQEPVSPRVMMRTLLEHPGYWIPIERQDGKMFRLGVTGAAGRSLYPVFSEEATLLAARGPDALQAALHRNAVFALLTDLDGESEQVVLDAGCTGELVIDARMRAALRELEPAARVEQALARLRWDVSETAAEAEAGLLQQVADHPAYTLVAENGRIILAPDDQGRRLLPVFTAADAAQQFQDSLPAPAELAQRQITTMTGAELFKWASELTLDGLVFNCSGPSRPVAFAAAFGARVLAQIAARAAPGLPDDPTGLPLPPQVLQQALAGNKMLAIKSLMEMHGIGLVLAKEWVETQQRQLEASASRLPASARAKLVAGSKIQAVAALREAQPGLGLAQALGAVDAALREDPALRDAYLAGCGLSHVVRLDIEDGLQLQSGMVAPASYALVVYCRVPDDWAPAGQYGPALQNLVFKKLYGENWLAGNSDGSRYVVRSVRSHDLDATQRAQRPWLAAADSPQQRHWFFQQLADGSLAKMDRDAF